MGFDKKKIDHILNGSQEALIYGFSSCGVYTVFMTLLEQGYHVYTCNNSPFLQIDPDSITGDHCKKIINMLMEENYKRQQNGKSIIPLIFIVGSDDGNNRECLNIERVANSHYTGVPGSTSVTERELRRCYKIYAESNDVMRKLAEETFKFVTFKQVINKIDPDQSTCELIPIAPFWKHPEWERLWQNRSRINPLRDHSIWNNKFGGNWRAGLNEVVNNESTKSQGNFYTLSSCNIL